MAGTYPVFIREVKRETSEAVTLVLEIPIHLNQEFDYEPGQYLTLELQIEGKKHRRPYSLSSSPLTDAYPAVTIKKVPGGLISTHILDQLKQGDFVHLLPPDGKFIPELNENNFKQYVLIGAGSGITPLMSIAKSVLKIEPFSQVFIWYGNRKEENIIFYTALESMISQYGGRLKVTHTLTQPTPEWKGETGRIAAYKCEQMFAEQMGAEWKNADYFLCGPGDMIRDIETWLTEKGVDKGKIKKEFFTLPTTDGQDHSAVVGSGEIKEGAKKVKIIFENQEYDLVIDDNTTLLDACIDADIDAPYACKMAACSTCRAKLLSGEVKMDDREILTDEEIRRGYILTCQSHPLNDVVVSYDAG